MAGSAPSAAPGSEQVSGSDVQAPHPTPPTLPASMCAGDRSMCADDSLSTCAGDPLSMCAGDPLSMCAGDPLSMCAGDPFTAIGCYGWYIPLCDCRKTEWQGC